jgi:hypothetical protein
VNRAQEALVKRDWVGDVGRKFAGMAGRGIYLRGILLVLLYAVVHW